LNCSTSIRGELIFFELQEPEPLSYLAEKNHVNYDIPLEVWSCCIEASFFALINFVEIKLIGGAFFSLKGLD